MEVEKNNGSPDTESRKRPVISRPRVIMGLLLLVAIPVFISLANRVASENSDAIRQILGR